MQALKRPPWHLLALAAAWVWLVVYAYPGQMTMDSLDHMREARAHLYTDAHPAVCDVLWKVIDWLPNPPLGWLLLQSGLLLGGLYVLARRTFQPRGAALWTAALYLFPPVFTVMGMIWKDCVMAGLLAAGFAGILAGPRRRGVQLAGLAALTGACAIRYNALGATAPLIVLAFEWRPGMRWLARYASSLGTWLASTALALGINAAITDKPMHYATSSLLPYDIAGTLAFVDEDLPDTELEQLLAGTGLRVHDHIHQAIRRVYTPRDFLPILNDPEGMLWDLPTDGYVPAPAAQREAIERAWRTVLGDYPLAYAKHRVSVLGEAMDIHAVRNAGGVPKREFRGADEARAAGIDVDASHFQRALTNGYGWLSRHSPLYLPWIYAVLALAMLWPARRHRDLLALLLSGLGLELTLLLLVHSRDYRYSHWLVLSTVFAAISLARRRYVAT